MNTRAYAAVILLSVATACTSAPRKGDARANDIGEASIDIVYVLGHARHRLFTQSTQRAVTGQEWLDKQILKEGEIDPAKYRNYVQKVTAFADHNQARGPAAQAGKPAGPIDDACRTPFTVTLKLGSDTRVVNGCRGMDEGALSRLVREGEFLLYSKK